MLPDAGHQNAQSQLVLPHHSHIYNAATHFVTLFVSLSLMAAEMATTSLEEDTLGDAERDSRVAMISELCDRIGIAPEDVGKQAHFLPPSSYPPEMARRGLWLSCATHFKRERASERERFICEA